METKGHMQRRILSCTHFMLAAEAVHRFFLLLQCGLTREEAHPFRLGPVQTALCSTVTSPGFLSVCSFLPAGEDW